MRIINVSVDVVIELYCTAGQYCRILPWTILP